MSSRAALLPRVRGFFGALLCVLVRVYQVALAPQLGGQCRFAPSCSNYALDAITRHGPFAGSALALRRIARCHPFHAGGFDPAPATPGARAPSAPRAVQHTDASSNAYATHATCHAGTPSNARAALAACHTAAPSDARTAHAVRRVGELASAPSPSPTGARDGA